jgi:DNA polymerase (family X)
VTERNATIAAVLRDIAAALRLRGESAYRIRAYERGADVIDAFRGALGPMIAEGRLTEIPGIGERLASIIEEVHATGTSKLLDELKGDLPEGALALARGPKLSKRAIATLSAAGIRDLDALRAAAKSGSLRALPGFTEKTEARILAEMARNDERRGRLVLGRALRVIEDLRRHMHREIEVVGDVRRGLEIVDAIDVLVATDEDRDAVRARFERWPGLVAAGVPVRLHVVPKNERAVAMQRLTGSAAHVAAFERAAERAGVVLGEVSLEREEDLYARARLDWVPPPLREGEGEIDAAAEHRLPKLVQAGDVRGIVHCHTTFSDGSASIEEMARAAEERGMEYITITDHSPTAHYAHGVELERLERQWDEIARAQERVSIRILRGTESDILKDGALDYPDAILERLDVVIASIHSRYALDAEATTARIIRALRHPMFKIWGHALGRLLLNRPPVACDVEAILDAAAESRVAIELNGDPYRLDMAPRWAKRAHARGIPFVVSVDAHSTRELDNVKLGALMAQRAGLEARDVLNTLGAKAFAERVRPS